MNESIHFITFFDSVLTVAFFTRPLYFQHNGHSRTIVGIQVKHQQNGMHQFNLLILDPSDVSITHVFAFYGYPMFLTACRHSQMALLLNFSDFNTYES